MLEIFTSTVEKDDGHGFLKTDAIRLTEIGGGTAHTVTCREGALCVQHCNLIIGVEKVEIKELGNYMPSETEAMGMGGGQIPMVVEKSSVVVQKCGDRDKEGSYSVHDYSNTIPANPMSDRGQMLVEQTCVAMRGRNPENPSDRTPGIELEQRLEPNTTGCTNTLTSVQKDNLILEETIVAYDEQNQTVRSDTFGTLTTDGSSPKHNNRVIKIRQATKQGFIECEVGGGMRFELPDKRIKTGKNNRERSDKSNPDNGEYP